MAPGETPSRRSVAVPIDEAGAGSPEAGRFEGPLATSPVADFDAPYARVAAVALIEARDTGRWLMLRTTHPEWFLRDASSPVPAELWGPAGGRLERGEDLEEALLREVREETGLDVEVGGPCYAYLTRHKGERLLSVTLACRVPTETEEIRVDPLEADAWRWMDDQEWLEAARSGLSPWRPLDVRRVTAMARELWRVTEADGP